MSGMAGEGVTYSSHLITAVIDSLLLPSTSYPSSKECQNGSMKLWSHLILVWNVIIEPYLILYVESSWNSSRMRAIVSCPHSLSASWQWYISNEIQQCDNIWTENGVSLPSFHILVQTGKMSWNGSKMNKTGRVVRLPRWPGFSLNIGKPPGMKLAHYLIGIPNSFLFCFFFFLGFSKQNIQSYSHGMGLWEASPPKFALLFTKSSFPASSLSLPSCSKARALRSWQQPHQVFLLPQPASVGCSWFLKAGEREG